MKQWQLGQQPGWQNLTLVDVPEPTPGAGEVLVRLRAASLNYRDLIVVDEQRNFTPDRVPLSDGAGEITAVGTDVVQWQVGDRVAGTFFRDWQGGRFSMSHHQAALGGSVDGVLREQAVFPQHGLVQLPDDYSYEEGSTLPCAGLTAWAALMTRGQFQPGDTALLLGTGGVSIWGLQIVAAAGGRSIITSSSDEKLERATALGAWETVNYRTNPDWEKEIHRLTAKQGVDHVLEVGGPQTLGKSLACVAAGGHIAQIGVLTGFVNERGLKGVSPRIRASSERGGPGKRRSRWNVESDGRSRGRRAFEERVVIQIGAEDLEIGGVRRGRGRRQAIASPTAAEPSNSGTLFRRDG